MQPLQNDLKIYRQASEKDMTIKRKELKKNLIFESRNFSRFFVQTFEIQNNISTNKICDFFLNTSKENPKTAELIKPKRAERIAARRKQTPFKLFTDYNNLLGNKLSQAEMRIEFNSLPIDAKYKWIEKSVKMYPNVNIGIYPALFCVIL